MKPKSKSAWTSHQSPDVPFLTFIRFEQQIKIKLGITSPGNPCSKHTLCKHFLTANHPTCYPFAQREVIAIQNVR